MRRLCFDSTHYMLLAVIPVQTGIQATITDYAAQVFLCGFFPANKLLAAQGINMIDFNNKGFFKLKQNSEYAEKVTALLLNNRSEM